MKKVILLLKIMDFMVNKDVLKPYLNKFKN